MKEISLKNVSTIFSEEFKMRLKSLLIWCAALSGVMLLYMILFPFMREMMQGDMGGMGDINKMFNFNTFFAQIFSLLITVLCGYAVVTASSCLQDEERTGTIEFLNSQSVSRFEIIIGKYLAIIVNVVVIYITISAVSVISGVIIDASVFNVGAVIASVSIACVPIFIFLAIGFLIASVLPKNIKASSIGLVVFFGTYLLGFVQSFNLDFLAFFKWFSPLDFINISEIMGSTIGIGSVSYNFLGYILGIVLTLICIGASIFLYKRKDL